MKNGPLFLFYCLLLLLGMSILILPEDVCAPAPDVTISLDDEEIEVDVGPGSDGVARFTGKVECNNHLQMVVVTLEGEAEFPSTITPSTIYLEPGETEEKFSAEVKVPNFLSSKNPIPLIISGSAGTIASPVSYSLEPVTGIIKIKPYLILGFLAVESEMSGEPGDSIDFELVVVNNGNYDEGFTIGLSEMNEPDVMKWDVTFSEDSFIIMEGKDKNISAHVKIPNGASAGEYEVILTTTSTARGGNVETVERELTLFIGVKSSDFFDMGNWYMYVVFIILALLIVFLVWKRKPILRKLRRRRSAK